MKLKLICMLLSLSAFLTIGAQKKNYISFETGGYFGNANSNIEQGMRNSGFADKSTGSFFGLFSWSTQYPLKESGKSQYRVRAGHYIKNNRAIEAGFGLSYYGVVQGYDEGNGGSHMLIITSQIHSLNIALVFSDSTRRVGFGIGPVLSFYKQLINDVGREMKTKSSVLPGLMTTSFFNIFRKRSWFLGLRTDLSFTVPAKIDEINMDYTPGNPKSSTFKSTKAGSFNGSISLQAGIRFTNK